MQKDLKDKMDSNLKRAYNVIDSVMQEVLVTEEQVLQGICSLLESENLKIKSKIIATIVSILAQWNKIPASEIKKMVEGLRSDND